MTPEKILEELEPRLPPAPKSVENGAGHPAFGTYHGVVPEVDLSKLAGPYALSRPERLLKHKRWKYTLVATPEVVAAFAIADLSYSATAFALAVDLKERKVLFDASYMGVPGPLASVGNRPGEGFASRFYTVGARLSASRGVGRERYAIDVDLKKLPFGPGLKWKGDVLAVGGPPALTVISPVFNGGVVNVTQKWAGLLSFGALTAGGKTFSLDGGVAGLDYTHGYLARHTEWRWAMGLGRMADGTPVGVNLVEGINDETDETNENAVWIGRRVIPLGRARFDFNRQDPLDEWRVRTTDGAVDLSFRPLHVHREERDFKLIRSRFAQPVGTFQGRLRIDGEDYDVSLAGVTEEQDVLW